MAVLAYEQRRIRTIRSTWVILLVTLALAMATAALLGAVANIDPATGDRVGVGELSDVLPAVVNPLVLVPLSVLAAMAFGGEYRFGLIRATLTTFPRRTGVFFAKLAVATVWMFVFLLLVTVAVVGVAYLFRANLELDPFAMANLTFALRGIVYGVLYCLFAFALALITRNQALAITTLVLWTVVLEGLLLGLLGDRFTWLATALPMSAGGSFVAGEDLWRNGAVFAGVLVALLALGWATFLRRDA